MSNFSACFDVVAGDYIEMYIDSTSDSSYQVNNHPNNTLEIREYPLESDQVLRIGTTSWFVDANISGADMALGSSSVSSYQGMTNGSLTMVKNDGSIDVQIPCSSTNAPSGLTCSSGDESNGVSFIPPRAGWVRACTSFSHGISNSADSTVHSVFQIVETPNNAQTVLQEGKDRQQSGSSTAGINVVYPHKICGNFYFDSNSRRTLRLFYEQVVANTPTTNIVITNADANAGNRDVRWEVYPISNNEPMINVTQAVTYDTVIRKEGMNGVTSIEVGTYTPSTSNTTNIDSISSISGRFTRIADQVEASIQMSIDPTAATTTTFQMSLPITSNFTGGADAIGTCVTLGGSGYFRVTGNSTNDTFDFQGAVTHTGATGYSCKINYVVK